MNKNIFKVLGVILSITTLFSCKDDGNFDNKAYLLSPKTETIIIKSNVVDDSKLIKVGIAKPEPRLINLKVVAEKSLLDSYNKLHAAAAVILPEANYSINKNHVEIKAGEVKSEDLKIGFVDLNTLNREKTFVLPIRITSTDIEILNSASYVYYVIKGGAIINVVANMNENYFNTSNFKNAAALNNLSNFTMEALIYPRELNRMISSIMGIEGYFLLRIGDASVPPNILQIASSTAGNEVINRNILLNKWTHIAVVYTRSNTTLKVYFDGQEVYNNNRYSINNLNMGSNGFHIGKSWDNNRSFNGEFSEVRIWNIARSKEDIEQNIYEVPANSPGLVAYWKINDGNGNSIKDYTSNENHLTANSTVKWIPVELPEKK